MNPRLFVRIVRLLLSVSLANACGCALRPSGSARDSAWTPVDAGLADATVSAIVEHPSTYVGRRVVVAGRFGGLPSPDSDPMPGTIAWVLSDGGADIAVVAPFPVGCLPPKTGLGIPLIVLADVQVTPAGRVYLAPAASDAGHPAR